MEICRNCGGAIFAMGEGVGYAGMLCHCMYIWPGIPFVRPAPLSNSAVEADLRKQIADLKKKVAELDGKPEIPFFKEIYVKFGVGQVGFYFDNKYTTEPEKLQPLKENEVIKCYKLVEEE